MKFLDFKLRSGNKKILLGLIFSFTFLLALDTVFSYSVPLSWIRNKTGRSVDLDNDGIMDRAEILLEENVGQGLGIDTSNFLGIEEGRGIKTNGNYLNLNTSYLKEHWVSLTEKKEGDEEHKGLKTIGGSKTEVLLEGNDTYERHREMLFKNNDTYNSTGQNVYNLIGHTKCAPISNATLIENETDQTLSGDQYNLNYTTGKINITDLNATAGDTEDVIINYTCNAYVFSVTTIFSPIYPNSVTINETYADPEEKLTKGENYTIDYCSGQINITDLNTTAGDNERVEISYKYPPLKTTGSSSSGILDTSHNPLVKDSISLTSGGNTLKEGKCKNYTVLDYQIGRIKLWRFNKTKGTESVNVTYNWTDFEGDVFWNSTTQAIETNESKLMDLLHGGYVLETGDEMTGDLNFNRSNLSNVNRMKVSTLRVGGNLGMESNYLTSSSSIKDVSVKGEVAYWPFDNIKKRFVVGTYGNKGKCDYPSLEGVWPMDEGIGKRTKDSTYNKNHGVLHPGEQGKITTYYRMWTTAGVDGSALKFDGEDSYIKVSDSDSLDLKEGLTFSVWVYLDEDPDTTGDNDYRYIMGKPSTSPYSMILEEDREISVSVFNTTGERYSFFTGYTLPLEEWHHLAYTYNSSTGEMNFYVDGGTTHSRTESFQPDEIEETTGDLFFSNPDSTPPRAWHGLMDEALLYSRPLSNSSVQELYERKKAQYITQVGGKVGKALKIEKGGAPKMRIPSNEKLSPEDEITLSAWIKVE